MPLGSQELLRFFEYGNRVQEAFGGRLVQEECTKVQTTWRKEVCRGAS
jgi:hypothetical protein